MNVEPASAYYRYSLAMTQQALGKYRDALDSYLKLQALDPGNPAARNNIAWIYGTSPDASVRNGARAIELLEPEAAKPDCEANLLDTLAAAYAEAGQYDRAVETAEKAVRKARQSGLPAGPVADMKKRLGLYKKHKPYRE